MTITLQGAFTKGGFFSGAVIVGDAGEGVGGVVAAQEYFADTPLDEILDNHIWCDTTMTTMDNFSCVFEHNPEKAREAEEMHFSNQAPE